MFIYFKQLFYAYAGNDTRLAFTYLTIIHKPASYLGVILPHGVPLSILHRFKFNRNSAKCHFIIQELLSVIIYPTIVFILVI